MNCIFILLLLAFFNLPLLAQPVEKESPWQYSISGGIARSRFKVYNVYAEDYPTTDGQATALITRKIGTHLHISSGLGLYFKGQRKSYMTKRGYYGKGLYLPRLDETTSLKYHVAIEIPLRVGITLGSNTDVNAGIVTRLWQATNLLGDILKSTVEFGYTLSLSQRVLPRLRVGAEAYFGISKLANSYIIGGGGYYVRQNYQALIVSYDLPKRRKTKG